MRKTWLIFGIALALFTGCQEAPPPSVPTVVITAPDEVKAGTPIAVDFKNLFGSAGDWVTVVPYVAPADQYDEWTYTQGKPEFSYTFTRVLQPGNYEIRVYFNWPNGKFDVKGRKAIRVIP